MSAPPTPLRSASDPSPGPRRLVKAPVAVHPLPLGEGEDRILSLPIPNSLFPTPATRCSTRDMIAATLRSMRRKKGWG